MQYDHLSAGLSITFDFIVVFSILHLFIIVFNTEELNNMFLYHQKSLYAGMIPCEIHYASSRASSRTSLSNDSSQKRNKKYKEIIQF